MLVQRARAWPRRVVLTVATIVLLAVGARVALPYFVRHQINSRLAKIPEYRGHVDTVTISLWRGAYTLNGLSIFKINGHEEAPFFLARYIDFSIAWRDLIHRKIVSDIYIDHGQLTIVKGPTPQTTQRATDSRWQSVIEDIFPIDIQHLEVAHGVIRYIDDTRQPRTDLFVKDMEAVATGLQNRPNETGAEFPASIQLQGQTIGGGDLSLLVQAEPLADKPHFHLSLKMTRVNLVALNESLKSVANVDVGGGTFDLVMEMAGRKGAFEGYVKPFFNHLDFHDISGQHKSIGDRLWERVVAGVAWLVKNKPRDQVATRIPFQGEFGSSQVGLWATIRNLFRHGFIRAFNPVVEGSVNPDKVPAPSQLGNGKGQKQVEQSNDAKSKTEHEPTK